MAMSTERKKEQDGTFNQPSYCISIFHSLAENE